MLDALRNAWHLPDLRRKILYTLLILAIYRLAAHIPVPGVDRAALQQLLQGTTAAGQLYIILDLLSGGAIANFLHYGHGRVSLRHRLHHPAVAGARRAAAGAGW
jgi:preprotein translocase subunit SecY